MTLCICHAADNGVIVDLLAERKPPFSPEIVTSEFATLCKSYTCYSVTGDRYGGEWPREQFRKYGVNYELAEQTKSQLYQALVPLLNSKRIDLLDHAKTVNQLVALERHVGRSGRDLIDHPPGQHDDLCNSLADACALVHRFGGYDDQYLGFQPEADDQLVEDTWHAERRERYHADLLRAYGMPVPLPRVN
jgi:hypothetical protein